MIDPKLEGMIYPKYQLRCFKPPMYRLHFASGWVIYLDEKPSMWRRIGYFLIGWKLEKINNGEG